MRSSRESWLPLDIPNWKDEEHILKKAYDSYRRKQKETSKTPAPAKREQQDRDLKRLGRPEPRDESRTHKRKPSSPTREGKKVNHLSKVSTSPK